MKDFSKITYVLVTIIGILIASLFISCDSYNKLKKENAELKQLADSCFWKQYAERADAYIDAIYDCDCDCIYDVAMETDAYDEYVEYYERIHPKEIK